MATKQTTLKINTDAKSVKDTFRDLSKGACDLIGDTKVLKEAFKGVNGELKVGQKTFASIHAKMTPDALRKRVRLQLAQEDASKKLHEAETKERTRQYKPTTALGRLGKSLGFDVSPGNKGGQSMLGGLGKKLGLGDEAAGLLGGIGKALGPATAALGVAVGISKAIQGIFKQMISFVQLANPGAVKRFNMAMEDTLAVIGHKLTPVIEIFTKYIRMAGDFLASILPSTDEFAEALAPLDDAFKDMREVLADLAPDIKEALTGSIRLFGQFVKFVWDGVHKLVDLAKALGLLKGGGKLTDSTGAAARQATFQDSTSYAKSIYQAIASQKGKDPNERTAENTAKTNTILESLSATWKDLSATWKALKGAFKFPELKLPDWLKNPFKLPEFKLPKLDFPDWLKNPLKLPEFKLPELKLPGWLKNPFKLPDFHLPEFKLPDLSSLAKIGETLKSFKLPDFKFPDLSGALKDATKMIPDGIRNALTSLPRLFGDAFKLPDFKFPELKLPDFKLPDFKFPDFKFPELKLPDLAFPDLAGPLTDAANKIPDAIKNALSELPDRIAQAIKSALPSLPSLPSLPGGGGNNPIGDAARRARDAWRGLPFGF